MSIKRRLRHRKPNLPPQLTFAERQQRDGMVWLLWYTQNTTLNELSKHFGVSKTAIKNILARVAQRMQRAATIRPIACPAYWRRLATAGAIKMPTGIDAYDHNDWRAKYAPKELP